jgi:hypothetical protein
MKRLIEVTRDDQAPHSIYLYYLRNAVARTQTLDDHCSVDVDFDSSGEVVESKSLLLTMRRLRLLRGSRSIMTSASPASLTSRPKRLATTRRSASSSPVLKQARVGALPRRQRRNAARHTGRRRSAG